MVMPTTMIVLSMVVDIPVMPISWMSQLTNGSEKLSAANAEERNPARVMATWMAERKLSGARIKASSLPAVLSPSSACFSSFVSESEMTAISAAAKKALIAISTIRINILGNMGSSDKIISSSSGFTG